MNFSFRQPITGSPIITLHYDYSRHNDSYTTVTAKVDDKYTTNNYYGTACKLVRRTALTNILGPDRLLKEIDIPIGNPASPVRIDSTVFSHTGFGVMKSGKDQEGWSDSVFVDGWNRPVRNIHADGNYTTTGYEFGTPIALLGDNDQEFYGLCERTTTTTETGKIHTQYKDALGRLRREMTDTTGLRLVTKYEYDELNRLITVVNPAGDTTRYWYDDFGRVRYKYQPDIGYLSYAYDNLGNVRFSQTAMQADSMRVVFTEYDELNRVVLVGEARLGGEPGGGCGHGHALLGGHKQEELLSFPPHPVLNLNRLTDQLDPNSLHDAGASGTLTRNASVWDSPAQSLPSFWSMGSLAQTTCVPQPMMELPVAPFLRHPAQQWADPWLPLANSIDFENIALYPENARVAVYYDDVPDGRGSVWEFFPSRSTWNALTPKSSVRNTKGNEVAVAYRQHAGEPYHYTVMSYDERNRVEAVLHYNENLGFDAVYYTYNALNQVTSVRVADPLRQYTTWYGYNYNGQVDSVWTLLQASGAGLGVSSPACPAVPTKPTTPDIVYSYTKRDQIAKMWYPPANAVVDYVYNKRKFLDSMVATKNGAMLFRQDLGYAANGNITTQLSQHSGQNEIQQLYNYDGANRIKDWNNDFEYRTYRHTYDEVGNRTWYKRTSTSGSGYFYTDPNGPNRLTQLIDSVSGAVTATTNYTYNADGALKTRTKINSWATVNEQFGYSSIQGRLTKYVWSDGTKTDDWRYRYNASGEREQKRLYSSNQAPVRTWDYYLLGGDNKQLAVYKGIEAEQTSCEPYVLGGVYMWPKEYLTYGLGDVHNLTTRPVDAYTGVKEYKIQDHLGSTRVVLSGGGTVLGRYDYTPFGGILWQSAPETRKMYIDKEKDDESNLGDFSARKYDDETGRFTSVDEWWEKYRAWSPYIYCMNAPLLLKDPTGKGGTNSVLLASPADQSRVDGGGMMGGPSNVEYTLTLGALVVGGVNAVWHWMTNEATSEESLQESKQTPDPSPTTSTQSESQEKGKKEEASEKPKSKPEERNWKQDKKLSDGEITKLKDKGHDIHELKKDVVGPKKVARYDIYKDGNGDLYVKPKGGQGAGEPLHININN